MYNSPLNCLRARGTRERRNVPPHCTRTVVNNASRIPLTSNQVRGYQYLHILLNQKNKITVSQSQCKCKKIVFKYFLLTITRNKTQNNQSQKCVYTYPRALKQSVQTILHAIHEDLVHPQDELHHCSPTTERHILSCIKDTDIHIQKFKQIRNPLLLANFKINH